MPQYTSGLCAAAAGGLDACGRWLVSFSQGFGRNSLSGRLDIGRPGHEGTVEKMALFQACNKRTSQRKLGLRGVDDEPLTKRSDQGISDIQ